MYQCMIFGDFGPFECVRFGLELIGSNRALGTFRYYEYELFFPGLRSKIHIRWPGERKPVVPDGMKSKAAECFIIFVSKPF